MTAAHNPPQNPRKAAQPVLLFGQIPDDRAAITRGLDEAGLCVEARAAGSPEDLAKALDEHAGHVILAYLAEGASVQDLVKLAHLHDPSAPVVVVATGAAPPRVAALIRAGARDAVLASDTEHLAAVIEREAATAQQARDAAALTQRVLRLEHIVEHIPVMLFSKDATTLEIELWNKTAERLSGVPRETLLGKTGADVWPDTPAYLKVDRQVLAGKVAIGNEEPMMTSWGQRWVFTSKVPVLDENGEAIALIGCSVDITERHAAEQALIEANTKLEASEKAKVGLIERLRYSIDELSTPILEVWDDVLVMPIIGVIDSRRTADMVQRLLAEVARLQASFVIIDLTGVDIVDTSTADHLMKLMRKVEVIGARCVLTGIRAAVAETLVDIGVDFGRLTTLRNLKHGLREALRVTRRDRSVSSLDLLDDVEEEATEKRRAR